MLKGLITTGIYDAIPLNNLPDSLCTMTEFCYACDSHSVLT
jgi:hypothetical protein